MSEGKIIEIYNQGISQVIGVIKELSNEIKTLNSQVEKLSKDNKVLNERVKSLESQANKNSNNSSKPPSSDGFKKKTKSLRKPTGKKPGGQPGHKGNTLEQVENPDEVIEHTIDKCSECGPDLNDIPLERYIVRQVIDLPEIRVKVTEHRAEVKKCTCGHINKAKFPEGVNQPVQYGTKIKATSVYLSQYQLVPYDRQEEVFKDLFSHSISKGTLASINES